MGEPKPDFSAVICRSKDLTFSRITFQFIHAIFISCLRFAISLLAISECCSLVKIFTLKLSMFQKITFISFKWYNCWLFYLHSITSVVLQFRDLVNVRNPLCLDTFSMSMCILFINSMSPEPLPDSFTESVDKHSSTAPLNNSSCF